MKRMILICSCLSLFLSATPLPAGLNPARAMSPSVVTTPSTVDHGGQIETKYDGFNNETVVTLKKMKVTCGGTKGLQSTLNQTCISLVASLHCPGKQLDYVRYAKFQLIFESKDWDKRHPLDERELFVVADGQRLKLGRMGLATHGVAGDRGIDVMKEVLEVVVPYKVFDTIARATTVEVKVGKSLFGLHEKNIEALRDLGIRVNL